MPRELDHDGGSERLDFTDPVESRLTTMTIRSKRGWTAITVVEVRILPIRHNGGWDHSCDGEKIPRSVVGGSSGGTTGSDMQTQ